MFKNMNIGFRLGLGFGLVTLLMVIVGLLAMNRVQQLDDQIGVVVEDRMPKVEWANGWVDAVNEVARVLRNEVILSNLAAIEKEDSRIDDIREKMDVYKDSLKSTITSPEGKKMLDAAYSFSADIREHQDQIRSLAKANNDSAAAALLFGEYRAMQGEYLKALAELISYQQHLAMSDGESAGVLADSTRTLIIQLLVAALILSLLLGWFITRSVTLPIARCIRIAEDVAKGDLDVDVHVDSSDEVGKLMAAMSLQVEKLKGLIEDMNRMSKAHDSGDIDVAIPVNEYQNSFRTMAEGVNAMVFGHIAVKKKAMACIMEFGQGNFEAPLERFPGKKVFINETVEQVRGNLKALIADALMLSQAAVNGKLATRADVNRHQGDFRKIVQGVNDTLDAVINPLNVAAKYVEDISKGVIPSMITDNYNGDFNQIKNNLNVVVKMMNDLLRETDGLVKAALGGQLTTRANAALFTGGWHQLVSGVNQTLDSVLQPINEASGVLEKVAARDMTARVKGEYQGDHAKIKNSLNVAVENLDKALSQVSDGAAQVASASEQISAGSQSQAQGANEQASSLEEISSSLEEIASMTKQNADNAIQAKNLSGEADNNARQGTEAMARMSGAIGRIKESSDQTAKIVKTIDEIAMQTNLLALNAAVEAARAGEAGRGFAVVAEEVRNLAQRSAQAAKNTADMIGESVRNADDGVKIAHEVSSSFEQIAVSSKKVNDLIAEIAAASKEQSQGIDQVTTAVTQMDKVTQQNAANSEESASASEELSSQAQELQSMVAQFALSAQPNSGGPRAAPAQRKTLQSSPGVRHLGKPVGKQRISAETIIPMDDDSLQEF